MLSLSTQGQGDTKALENGLMMLSSSWLIVYANNYVITMNDYTCSKNNYKVIFTNKLLYYKTSMF